jgi:hypothetical protein
MEEKITLVLPDKNFFHQSENVWKVIKNSIRNTHWFDTVTKVKSEAGQIAYENSLCLQ